MRIVRLIVEVAGPTSDGMDKAVCDDDVREAVENACWEAEGCLAAEVVEVKRVEVAK